MPRFLSPGLLVATLMIGGAGPGALSQAWAQTSPAQTSNWAARCDNQTPRLCEVFQVIQGTDEARTQARITIRKAELADQFRFSADLPNGVWLPVGVTVFGNDKVQRFPLTFKRCIETCRADLIIGKKQLQDLRGLTGQGHIEFQLREGYYLELPFSWQGVGPALASTFP